MKFTMDSKLGTLLDDPQAKKVLDQYAPGLSDNPMIAMAKGMTLTMLLAMPQAKQYGITKEKVQSVLDEINKQVK
jgi:alpha-L-rhamnosidase